MMLLSASVFAKARLSIENAQTVADQKNIPICAIYNVLKLKDDITSLGKNDKFMHCALSCQLTLRCGAYETLNIGILKELWDLISPGNAELEDLKADIAGINLVLKRKANNDYECINKCDELYKGVSK